MQSFIHETFQSFNRQNDGQWVPLAKRLKREDLAVNQKMKPQSVMVCVGFGYDFQLPLIFIPVGKRSPKIDSRLYREKVRVHEATDLMQ